MSHITRLQADNFKRLRVIDIRPGTTAGVVPIRGRNAQGKSSTLDAIMAALGGKANMPTRPVRAGEDEGSIRLELDDGAVIVRRFTVDGKGDSIEVTNADGFKAPSPQRMLDGLYASLAFDPIAFFRLEPKDQLGRLRGLVTLDVDVAGLERANAADFEKRAEKNREHKTERARLEAMPAFPDAPDQPVDEAALEEKIASAAQTNGEIETKRAGRQVFLDRLDADKDAHKALQEQAHLLAERITESAASIAERQAQVDGAKPLRDLVDVTQAQADLREARETNRQVQGKRTRAVQVQLVDQLASESQTLTDAMEGRRAEIAASIARAKMPVPGLGFGDGEVLFNDLPLGQASSAEQLRVSTAIGMASAPKLRVMLVRDGSLLDDEGEKLLADMAAENDFQLWVEAVDSTGKVGIVLEDGAVVAIDGAAPPEPEEVTKPKRRARKEKPADDDVRSGGADASDAPGTVAEAAGEPTFEHGPDDFEPMPEPEDDEPEVSAAERVPPSASSSLFD